jgi:YesN/AraC family two-component response regulator
VLLADGETLERAGLRELLERGNEIVLVGEAGSGRATVAWAYELDPDVVMVNVRLLAWAGSKQHTGSPPAQISHRLGC